MTEIKITDKAGVTLKTAGKYCSEDISVTIDESLFDGSGGSASVKTPSGYQGTPIPQKDGEVSTIYLNTKLSIDEVISIINRLELTDGQYEVFYYDSDAYQQILVGDMTGDGGYIIMHNYKDSNGEYQYVALFQAIDMMGTGVIGWQTFDNPITFNALPNKSYGLQNSLIYDLISTTEIIYKDSENIELNGEYDGTNISVISNQTLDVKSLLDNGKLPLNIEVSVPPDYNTFVSEFISNGGLPTHINELNINVSGELYPYSVYRKISLKKITVNISDPMTDDGNGMVYNIREYALGECGLETIIITNNENDVSRVKLYNYCFTNTYLGKVILDVNCKVEIVEGHSSIVSNMVKSTVIFYVPDSFVDSYKADTNWIANLSDVNTQIKPRSEYVEE